MNKRSLKKAAAAKALERPVPAAEPVNTTVKEENMPAVETVKEDTAPVSEPVKTAATPVAETAKEAAAEKTPVKRTRKTAVKKETAEKKPTEKKTVAAKKQTEKKTAAEKKAAAPRQRRTAKKAAEPMSAVYFEYADKKLQVKEIEEKATEICKAANAGVEIRDLKIYVVAEENMVYCVVNDDPQLGCKFEL